MRVAHLDDRAIVRIAGPDAATLLQNVVTLDLAGVDRHRIGYGALLTPQGKILWDFILHALPDGYAADLRADQTEAFAKRLSLYKLRAKVEIAPAPEFGVFAAWDDSHSNVSGDSSPSPQGGTEGAPDPRLPALGRRWVAPVGAAEPNATHAHWHARRVALAIPEGGVDFAFGDTFPHDAAMDSLHGVAFEKGCYIGQEVVSRMRHRGTARRRVVALQAAEPLPEPGADIIAADVPVGRLGSSADGRAIGIARLDRLRAALDAGQPVHVGGLEVAVSLPAWATYDWPAPRGEAEGAAAPA
jgi:folate-binding protein YgfZ